jgi:hypothetical protein
LPSPHRLRLRAAYTRKALSPFAQTLNEADGEGMFFLDRLPTPEEAEIIRDKLSIAKKREISDAERARLRAMGAEHGFVARRPTVETASVGVRSASDDEPQG